MERTPESNPSNSDIFEGRWKQMRGEPRSWWGRLTNDDLEQIGGHKDKLIGRLQERYSYTRERARQEVERRLQEYHARLGAASPSGTTPPLGTSAPQVGSSPAQEQGAEPTSAAATAANQATSTEPSLAQLLTGMVDDAKALLRQELALATHEIREDLRKTKTAMVSLGMGSGVAALGGLLLILMLVHLLQALAELPLWACYGMVGGLFVLVGGVLLLSAQHTIARIHVVPPHTVDTMQENVQWLKEQVTPDGISKAHVPR